jgi:hypothetical protein
MKMELSFVLLQQLPSYHLLAHSFNFYHFSARGFAMNNADLTLCDSQKLCDKGAALDIGLVINGWAGKFYADGVVVDSGDFAAG